MATDQPGVESLIKTVVVHTWIPVISSVELFEALDITDEPPLKIWLFQLPELVDDRVYARWEMKGYDDYRYK